MKTMMLVAMVVAAGCGGCSSGLRGDGTLAVIEISDKLHEMRYQAVTITHTVGGQTWTTTQPAGDMVDAFCAGAHVWDVVGAQVRCEREVEGQHALSSIGVVLADEWEYPGHAAWWNSLDGKIHFATMQWSDRDDATAAAAHEIGHALGLDHLGAGNLMAADIESVTLTDEDRAAFCGHWPAATSH
jgi:hypothetical protein